MHEMMEMGWAVIFFAFLLWGAPGFALDFLLVFLQASFSSLSVYTFLSS